MRKEQFKWAADAPVVHIFGEDVPRVSQPGKKQAAATPKPLTKTAARPRTPVQPASNTSNVKSMLRGLTTTADKSKITAPSGSKGSPITGQGALTAGAATGGLQEPQKMAKRLEAGIRQPQKDEPKSIAAKENVVPIFSQKESREPGLQDAFLRNFQKDSLKPTPLPLFTVPGEVKPAVKVTPLKAQTQRSTGAVQAPGSAATAAATPKPVQQTTTTKPLQRGIVKPTLAPELAGEQPALTGTKPVTQPKLTLKDQPKATLAPELGAQKEVGRTKAPSDEGRFPRQRGKCPRSGQKGPGSARTVKLPKLGNLTEGEKGRTLKDQPRAILAPELKGENPAVSTPKRTMTPNTPAKATLAPEQEERTPEQKVMNWIIDWAGRNGIFTDNFKNRYANRTWDYTDAYIGDAQDYLDMVKRETQNFEAELNGIRELMAQCNFSPEQMEHIGRLLNLSAEHYKLIRQTAEEDAAHWTQFGSAEEYQKVLEAAKIKVELDEMAGVKDEADKLLSQISTFNPYAYADAAQAAEAEQALKAQLAELTKPWGGWNGFENAYAEKQEQYNSLLGIETGSWFQKGAFADGYQFGDVTKTLVGTVNDINENITHAVLDATENLIDTGAFVVGQAAGRYGATDFQDKMGEFIAKEPLTKDEMGAKLNSILNWTTPHGQATKLVIGDNTEGNSVLGDKADGLTQSAAHLAGSKALSMVGIPAELTMGVNAFGSEIENAYKNGATHTQAWISASVAAGAEILFERLSDGLKSPKGTNVDDTTMQTLSQNISQKVVNTLLKWFKEDATEGLEEVFTDIVNKVAQKLTYADKMTWEKVFSTEDAWDSFLSGLLLSRGMSGADAIAVNGNAIQYEGLEDIAGKLSRGEALSAAEQQRLLDAVLKNTAPDTAADSNQSSRVAEPGKFRMTGWDGRMAVEPATGPKVTVDGKTYALLGKDVNGSPVYQDVEVLQEQNAQLEAEKRAEIKPFAKEASDNENKINWLSKGESLTVDQYRDLRQYATEKSVVLQGFKNSDVAIDLAKEMIYEVNRMLSIYPELRGSAKKPFTLNLDRHMESVDFAEVREGASHIMHINIDAFRNQEILGQEYEKLAESGWFVKGTSYKSIIYHEIGHIVSDVYGVDGLSLMKKVLGTDSTAETLLWCKNNLSEYSFKSDGSEIISEMFSAYYGSEKPPKEVVDFMSICDRMIKDWREVK